MEKKPQHGEVNDLGQTYLADLGDWVDCGVKFKPDGSYVFLLEEATPLPGFERFGIKKEMTLEGYKQMARLFELATSDDGEDEWLELAFRGYCSPK